MSTHRSPSARRPWTVLVLLCAAQFMVVLDITVVNVALPSIGADLGFATSGLQSVVTAYVLLSGGLLMLGGRAADRLGRRRVFLAGTALFTAASLAAGLAPSPGALVVARAAQGLGAALLTPSALALVTTTYTGAQRAAALSTWGAVGSAGAAAGMLIGGLLTTWLGWRAVFGVNVPVGAAVLALAPRLLPAAAASAARGRERLDAAGAVALVAGLGALVVGLQDATSHGWGSARTLALLAAAAALLAAFAGIERTVPRPLVPPATWRDRALVAGAALMLGATGILVGAFFLTSLYLQRELGASALETGLGFLPIAVAIGAAAHAAAHLLSRAGSRAVAGAGLALVAAGALALAVAPDHAGYATGMLPGLLLLGLGVGLVFPAASVTGMSAAGAERAGLASGLLSTAHELGAALGVAVLAAVAAPAAGIASGYGHAFLVAAAVAAVLAAAAAAALPAVRPPHGSPGMALH